MEYHAIVSVLVITLTFFGYVPYIWDILKGKTKPHAFTWFVVAVTAFVAYALQLLGGAGVGAWPMLTVAVICIVVFLLSLWRGTRDITKSDIVLFILSLVALFLWLVVKQPVLSVILITVSEVLAFVPTIRKSWSEPYSETLSLYEISAVRHGLSILALQQINLLTALYPAAWSLTNVVISTVLLLRRKRVAPEPLANS